MRLDIPSARLDRPAGDRSAWFRLCTRDVDRHGTVIEPAGVVLDAFRQNPVFCWMHPLAEGEASPGPDRVIGRVTAIEQSTESLDICVRFAEHGLAQLCFEQVQGGYLGAVSIFGTVLQEETRSVGGQTVKAYTALELVEASLVIAGSNKAALRLNRAVQHALRAQRGLRMTREELQAAMGMPADATRKVMAARLAEMRAALDEHYPKDEGGEGEGGEKPKEEGGEHAEPDGDEAVKKEAARLAADLRGQVDGLIKAGHLPAADSKKWHAKPALALGVARQFAAGTFTTSQRLRSGNVGTPVEVEETAATGDGVAMVARSLLAKARGERPDRATPADAVTTTAAQLLRNARGQARG